MKIIYAVRTAVSHEECDMVVFCLSKIAKGGDTLKRCNSNFR